jgi:peptidyl-tRNA hydrolase, PTH2 family
MNLKQVIIVRKDLNMRKGKFVAQGAHASLTAFMNAQYSRAHKENASEWYLTQQTKICVGVESEQELQDVYQLACNAKLPCSLIRDAGKTEFKEPTFTSVCIGPADADQIDKITGNLKLL